MKRLLCIVSNLNQGGAETFLMKVFRNIDRSKYIMDFCVMNSNKGKYEDEVALLGGKIYHVVPKTNNPIKCFLEIKKIVKIHGYKYVMRINEHSLSVIDLIAAKCGGAKKLIMRSSNADSGSDLSRVLHKVFNFLPKTVPHIKIAPSTEAAVYTFGKKNVDKGNVIILKNGLNISEFSFSSIERERLRKELNIENKFVVGHIGRFQRQKNHSFLIEIFKEVQAKKDDAILLLVGGNGELNDEVRNLVDELGLKDSVKFLGNRTDVPSLLSVFDVLVFPSLYEGMPNVVLEAQAAGLRCVISDTITKEADITDLVRYLPLECSAEKWAESVVEFGQNYKRKSYVMEFEKAGYHIINVARHFVSVVF